MGYRDTDRTETQEIVEAMRLIQESPELQAEARTDPHGLVERLGLSEVAKHAVAAGLTLVVTGAVVAPTVKPMGWWF